MRLFILTKRTDAGRNKNDNALSNPIPEPIKLSGLIADLQLVTQIPASSDSGKSPLARITEMRIQPMTNDLFVLDLRGKLYRLRNNKPVRLYGYGQTET